jgi:hypothetical protein
MPIAQIPEKGEIKAGFSVFHLKKLVEPQKFNPSLQNHFKNFEALSQNKQKCKIKFNSNKI